MSKLPMLIWLMAGAAVHGFGGSGSAQGPEFKPCPDSPNCVSSLSSDPRHAVAPIAFKGSASQARRKLLEVIRSMPRSRVVCDEGACLHVEYTSALFGFVDDVEFFIDDERHLVHVRSASRTGYWDLGANRKRVEEIRRMLTEEPAP